MQEDQGWKEEAQKRASRFLSRITPRFLSLSGTSSESEAESTKTLQQVSAVGPAESAQKRKVINPKKPPLTSPVRVHQPLKDKARVPKGGVHQRGAPNKLNPATSKATTNKLEHLSNRGVAEHKKLNQPLPPTTINTKDLREFLQSLGIDHVDDLASVVHDEPLTEAQIDAFRAVFELFVKNTEGCIDAEGLSSTLDSVGITVSPNDVQSALKKADYDKDGMVGFHDFLTLMTDSHHHSKCVKAEGTDGVDVSEKVFYKTLTKMLNAETLPSSATGEIVRYYHKKTLCVIRQAEHLDDEGDHVLTYYLKGAHLLGLNCKQLMKHMKPLVEKSSQKDSPYLKYQSLKFDPAYLHLSLNYGGLTHMGRLKTSKTWRTVEIEERIRKLSIKHPGMETKEMITPVKIQVNLELKDREHLTYNHIKEIVSKSQAGLKLYLKTLTQYKQRDSWNAWGSLQSYCKLHRCKHFPQTFSTYSWSWTACRNMMEAAELQQGKRPAIRTPETQTLFIPELPPIQERIARFPMDQEDMDKVANPRLEQRLQT